MPTPSAGMDRNAGVPTRRRGAARRQGAESCGPRPAGPAGSLYPRADLCPRQRLSEELEAPISAPVKAGQLLAEIEAPDLDQQIMQARADLAQRQGQRQARANATLKRGQSLISTDAIAKQDLDQRTAPRTQQRPGQAPRRPISTACRRSRKYQAHHRAVRRPRHRAQHRRRRADQCRAGGGPPLFVVSDTQQAARLCQRAAELCAEHPGRHQGADLACPNIRAGPSRRRSRPPRRPSTRAAARRGCSSSSTTAPAS